MKIIKMAQTESWYTEEVANNTTDPEILRKILEKGKDDYVSRNAARNPNCPPEALAKALRRSKDNGVSYYAARNPNCPPETLAEILRRGKNDIVSINAARNPNCPPELLAEILRKGNNNLVSYYATLNPNCSPKAKLDWYRATGKLTKYDPTKHKIDKQEIKEDKDLKELENLLAKNNNWYKITQKELLEPWYKIDIARYTTDPEILRKILEKSNDDLVSVHAANNPNCPQELLVEILRRDNDDLVSQYAASNLNCPSEALVEVLSRGKDNLSSMHAAVNPNCPPEILVEILRRGNNDRVSQYAARNPNCPPELLAEVLRKGKDDYVSYFAAENHNCPPKDKLLWMKATGKITTYDPTKHKIDKVEPKEDKDLKELENLLARNNKEYKIAQTEPWYTEGVAKHTDDPNILRKILEKGNDDGVSYYAVKNPNCPPDILVEILRRGKDNSVSRITTLNPNCPPEALEEILRRGNDDYVSRYAANNPNCPPEALAEILKRVKHDGVSRNAARNPNCPPEVLAEILRKEKDDSVSYHASENTNCPPEAKLKWMKATGKLTTYDPTKHVIDKIEPKEDKDLKELEKLLAKNNKKYKIANTQSEFYYWLSENIKNITQNYKLQLPFTSEELNVLANWAIQADADYSSLTLEDAIKLSKKWKKEELAKSYTDHNTIYKYKDGWDIVLLSNYKDIENEKEIMTSNDDLLPVYEDQYSLFKTNIQPEKGETVELYSLRDPKNNPHATIEIRHQNQNPKQLTIVDIFSNNDLLETDYGSYLHPEHIKIKEFTDYLKSQGYKFNPIEADFDYGNENIDMGTIDQLRLYDPYGIPYSFNNYFGGDNKTYFNNIREIYELCHTRGYFDFNLAAKKLDTLIQYAAINNELDKLEEAANGYSFKSIDAKTKKERINYEGFSDLVTQWLEDQEEYMEHKYPGDEPIKEDFMIPPDPNQLAIPGIPPPVPTLNKEEYDKALQEYKEKMNNYESERDALEKNFDPLKMLKYINEQIKKYKENTPMQKTKKSNNMTKIYKIADKIDEKLPDGEALSLYVKTLKDYLKDNPNIPEEWIDLISKMPSPRQVKQDLSRQECKILYETIEYLWEKITTQKIIPDEEIIKAPETLMGNYWLLANGIILEGVNHYDIIKKNNNLICSILNINGMTLQEYLHSKPNRLIGYIIKNGGVRLFINKNKQLFSQCNSEIYGKWAKNKIQKMDFKNKTIKIIDLKVDYKGWNSGISIRL